MPKRQGRPPKNGGKNGYARYVTGRIPPPIITYYATPPTPPPPTIQIIPGSTGYVVTSQRVHGVAS